MPRRRRRLLLFGIVVLGAPLLYVHLTGTAALPEGLVPPEGRWEPVWMDEEEIRANLEREYRPGQELSSGVPR